MDPLAQRGLVAERRDGRLINRQTGRRLAAVSGSRFRITPTVWGWAGGRCLGTARG